MTTDRQDWNNNAAQEGERRPFKRERFYTERTGETAQRTRRPRIKTTIERGNRYDGPDITQSYDLTQQNREQFYHGRQTPENGYRNSRSGYGERNYNRPVSAGYGNEQPRPQRVYSRTYQNESYAGQYQRPYQPGQRERQFDENRERNYNTYNQGNSFRPRRETQPDVYGRPARSFNPNNRPQRPKFAGKGRPTNKPEGRNMKRPVFYREFFVDPNEEIRLNRFLANAGICSRREADDFISAGVVKVNGEVVTELGTKIKRSDNVMFHDQPVSLERKIYVLLNKPKDTVTSSDDPQGRRTVMDLVKDACPERIYPVGRLDRNTTGVLLLTNDGDLASKLTHPKYLKRKIYQAQLDKEITPEDIEKIATGITLEDGDVKADQISYIDPQKKNVVGIEIHSGKNRIVRRIFEALGYRVVRLDRVFFAGLTKKGLKRGDWRHLTQNEVNFLRMGSF